VSIKGGGKGFGKLLGRSHVIDVGYKNPGGLSICLQLDGIRGQRDGVDQEKTGFGFQGGRKQFCLHFAVIDLPDKDAGRDLINLLRE